MIKEGTWEGDVEVGEGKAGGLLEYRTVETMCFLEGGDKCPGEL